MSEKTETEQTTQTTNSEATPAQTTSTPSLETATPEEVSSEPEVKQEPEVKPEVKTEPEVKPEVKTEPEAKQEPAPVVPSEEESDLELSEESLLSEEDLNEIAEEAARLNLPKADAEKLLAMRENALKSGMTKEQAAHQAKIEKSRAELLAHPDFSGEKAESSWQSVGRAVETFGTPELMTVLNTPGIGDNLVLAQFLKRIGDSMAPDTIPMGGSLPLERTAEAEKDSLRSLYPDFFKDDKK